MVDPSRAAELVAHLVSMADHSYGENVTMLDHSLQCAALAEAAGGSEEMVLAALLHDVGHVLGDAGEWGFASHAEAGAAYLSAFFGPGVVEPIRLHVDAKRYLVATDPAYAAALSHASTMSLAEQGGPFDVVEAAAFEQLPHAAAALRLRRWDDAGKVADNSVAPLATYRGLFEKLLVPGSGDVATWSAAWVRDACSCAACRDAGNGQHLIDIDELFGWRVESVVEHSDHTAIELTRGTERHLCVVRDRPSAWPVATRLWGPEAADEIIAGSVTPDDSIGFCRQLASTGICLVDGVSTEPGSVLGFGATVGYVRETNYGTLFDVLTLPDPNNLAYTSLGLPLHTDNPYRDPCPTVQLLHCLAPASTGGDSTFSDGFAAAAELERVDPAAYTILTSTALTFGFTDAAVDLSATHPMIEVGPDGAVSAIRLNHRSMQAPDPSVVDIDAFYRAYRQFVELINANKIEIRLQAGQLVGFDNRRVLHARSAYDMTDKRHLQGCYIDIDAVLSTARLSG